MLTIVTALTAEAKPWIDHFHAKAEADNAVCRVYLADGVRILITGSGPMAACAAVAGDLAKHPASPEDLLINVGIAGALARGPHRITAVGGCFLAVKLTEQATGRTFYPDPLYQTSFPKAELYSVPLPADDAKEAPTLPVLIDMEAAAVYQAALPYLSPERMFFFKIASDLLPTSPVSPASIPVQTLILPHLTAILSFLSRVRQTIQTECPQDAVFSPEGSALWEQLCAALPMTASMRQEALRLFRYRALCGKDVSQELRNALSQIPHGLRGKKSAAPYLERLRASLLSDTSGEGPCSAQDALSAQQPLPAQRPLPAQQSLSAQQPLSTQEPLVLPPSSMDASPKDCVPMPDLRQQTDGNRSDPVSCAYAPFFSAVYVEESILNHDLTNGPSLLQAFLHSSDQAQTVIPIRHYKEVFNRSRQNFAAQKKAPSLILARKEGTLLYPGAPVCQSFGKEHFYYTSNVLNCIYHCDYCYLQGMYPSGHLVVFVNLEDTFAELERLLCEHPVYLCVSYDTDLLALEPRLQLVRQWLVFAAEHPGLTLEIRTKSAHPSLFSSLAAVCPEPVRSRVFFAWTLSPPELAQQAEHGAPSIPLRLAAAGAARSAGFPIRLCFDPMLCFPGWRTAYHRLVTQTFSTLSPEDVSDVSIGVFRVSGSYLKLMRKRRPDCAIVQFPYVSEHGVAHYGALSKEMTQYLKEELTLFLPEQKLFVWDGTGGNET